MSLPPFFRFSQNILAFDCSLDKKQLKFVTLDSWKIVFCVIWTTSGV